MRLVENSALSTMASPIRGIFTKLHEALVHIAPERKERFDTLYPEFTLEYLDSHEWVLHVTEQRRILISSFVLEFLWAVAYAHFVIYTRIFQGKKYTSRSEIDLGEDRVVSDAMRLLKWAVEKLVMPNESNWPADLPKPQMSSEEDSEASVADEIALGSAACLLHHELAHIAMGHKGGSDIQSERDADQHAWEWILADRTDFDAVDLRKRLLLLSHAYSIGIIRDAHRGQTSMLTHPRSIDRLFQILTHFNLPDNHQTYAYAFATLYLHLENSENRLPVQQEAYNSFFESFDVLIDHMSRFPTII